MAILLIALYSVAAYERDLVGAAFGGGAVMLAANLDLVRFGLQYDDFWPFRLLFLSGAWAAGRLMLGRRRELERVTVASLAAEREHESRTQTALAEERARLARELHDVVAHNVSVMVVQAGAAEAVLAERPEEAREPLRRVQETGRQTVLELRRMLDILKEDDAEWATAPQPSLRDFDQLVDQVRASGLAVHVSVEGEPTTLPASLDLSAYRIVQEALTNVLRHAGAGSATVAVRYGDRALEIAVVDDGRGAPREGSGHGLVGMRARAALFGGSFEAGNRRGGGYGLRAVLPFERVK